MSNVIFSIFLLLFGMIFLFLTILLHKDWSEYYPDNEPDRIITNNNARYYTTKTLKIYVKANLFFEITADSALRIDSYSQQVLLEDSLFESCTNPTGSAACAWLQTLDCISVRTCFSKSTTDGNKWYLSFRQAGPSSTTIINKMDNIMNSITNCGISMDKGGSNFGISHGILQIKYLNSTNNRCISSSGGGIANVKKGEIAIAFINFANNWQTNNYMCHFGGTGGDEVSLNVNNTNWIHNFKKDKDGGIIYSYYSNAPTYMYDCCFISNFFSALFKTNGQKGNFITYRCYFDEFCNSTGPLSAIMSETRDPLISYVNSIMTYECVDVFGTELEAYNRLNKHPLKFGLSMIGAADF